MPIPRDFIDELLTRTDITELVGSYVQLKQSGSNSKGLCPFHTEKTPSFNVNADMQIYKCFGCGKGGNAIQFVMEIENLPFHEAVEMLARRAGMEVPEEEGRGEYVNRKKRILELNRDAAKFFHKMLAAPQGQAAREYLASRGISKVIVTKFGIGAAPNDWTLLLDAMIAKGYKKQELFDAGLARQKGSGAYDFFRDRVMFPVIDVRGDVVAFSGRALDPEAKSYKYLNSPDTIAFSKGKNLFGLNLARKSKAGMILLVEGNFGVVTLHQAGFDSAVAQLGSAFTPEHARLLAHYTEKIILAFDGDDAGRKATLKALPLIEATGKSVMVADFGDGDPDDFIKAHGADAFRVLIERGENHAEYRLQTILNKNDISTDAGKLAYLADATQYLAQINSIPEREIYTEKVSKIVGVSIEGIKNEVTRILKKKQAREKAELKKAPPRPRETVQPVNRSLKYSNTASAVAEEGIIRCLMKDRTLIKTIRETDFSADEFTADFLGKVFSSIETRLSEDKEVTPALVMSQLEPGEASHLTTILDKPEVMSSAETALQEYIGKIRSEKYKHSAPDGATLLEIAKMKKGDV